LLPIVNVLADLFRVRTRYGVVGHKLRGAYEVTAAEGVGQSPIFGCRCKTATVLSTPALQPEELSRFAINHQIGVG
jgi:hypothetical protein